MAKIPYRPVAIYLRPNYLAKGLTAAERLRCHVHNYQILCDACSPFRLTELLESGVALIAREGGRCVLSAEPRATNQNELVLTLKFGPEDIYALGFGFAPGEVFGREEANVLLVSRMQGLAEDFETLRQATKYFDDTSPQHLLFAALLGVAEAFGVQTIVGVSAAIQPSFNKRNAEQLVRSYDSFFMGLDAEPAARGVFVYPRARFADPDENLPAKHRARAKARRRRRAALAEAAAAALAPFLRAGSPHDEHYVPAHLFTDVGELQEDRFVAGAAAGYLLYGPYVRLEAGAYRAVFHLEGPARPQEIALEAQTDRSSAMVARRVIADWRAGDAAELEFTLGEPRSEVEFCLAVPENSQMVARGVTLQRREP